MQLKRRPKLQCSTKMQLPMILQTVVILHCNNSLLVTYFYIKTVQQNAELVYKLYTIQSDRIEEAVALNCLLASYKDKPYLSANSSLIVFIYHSLNEINSSITL